MGYNESPFFKEVVRPYFLTDLNAVGTIGLEILLTSTLSYIICLYLVPGGQEWSKPGGNFFLAKKK